MSLESANKIKELRFLTGRLDGSVIPGFSVCVRSAFGNFICQVVDFVTSKLLAHLTNVFAY